VSAAEILAASATGNSFHDGGIQQWAVDAVEQLYFDQVPAHMSLFVLYSRQFDGFGLGNALPVGYGSSGRYSSQSPQLTLLYQVSFGFVLCPLAVLYRREIVDT